MRGGRNETVGHNVYSRKMERFRSLQFGHGTGILTEIKICFNPSQFVMYFKCFTIYYEIQPKGNLVNHLFGKWYLSNINSGMPHGQLLSMKNKNLNWPWEYHGHYLQQIDHSLDENGHKTYKSGCGLLENSQFKVQIWPQSSAPWSTLMDRYQKGHRFIIDPNLFL